VSAKGADLIHDQQPRFPSPSLGGRVDTSRPGLASPTPTILFVACW
jgi:hypothetical protein